MGDQRRRSKSRGCQKGQEEQREDEEESVCRQVYTEWAWPLLTIHPGEREGGRTGEKAGTGTGLRGGGRVQEGSKEGGGKKNERST